MDKIKILALFGESGVGKDSIQRWLVNNFDMNGIIACTTRPPRDYETNGKEYYFISSAEFLHQYVKNEILNLTIFNDWFYGTLASSLSKDKINVGVFNPDGIKELLKQTDLDVLPVWIQVNEKTRLLRCLNREKNPNCAEVCRRFLSDLQFPLIVDFDYEHYLNDGDNFYGFLNRPKIKNFIQGQD